MEAEFQIRCALLSAPMRLIVFKKIALTSPTQLDGRLGVTKFVNTEWSVVSISKKKIRTKMSVDKAQLLPLPMTFIRNLSPKRASYLF
jgi:hypothetical protein